MMIKTRVFNISLPQEPTFLNKCLMLFKRDSKYTYDKKLNTWKLKTRFVGRLIDNKFYQTPYSELNK